VLTGAALRWVLRLVPLASLVGEQVDASLDIELACEIDRVIPGDEDMRRLRVDDAGDACRVLDAGHRAGRADLAVGGHHARVGADDPVGLDRTADAGVEPRVRFEDAERRLDRVEGRVGVDAAAGCLVEGRLSGSRLVRDSPAPP